MRIRDILTDTARCARRCGGLVFLVGMALISLLLFVQTLNSCGEAEDGDCYQKFRHDKYYIYVPVFGGDRLVSKGTTAKQAWENAPSSCRLTR